MKMLPLAFLFSLLATLAFAQEIKVGDSFDEVSKRLGTPTLSRVKDGNGMANYPDGTRLKIRDGRISSVEKVKIEPPKPKEEVIEKTNIWEVSAKEAAARDAAKGIQKKLHAQLLKDVDSGLLRTGGKKAQSTAINKSRYLFSYFSAHWCAPCRQFTPTLVEWYKNHANKGDFELLFVSSDRDQASMDTYMSETGMPWLGLSLDHPLSKVLKKKYEDSGIPCLVLVDENDALIASSFTQGQYQGPEVALRHYEAIH